MFIMFCAAESGSSDDQTNLCHESLATCVCVPVGINSRKKFYNDDDVIVFKKIS